MTMQHSFLKISIMLCCFYAFNVFSQDTFSWQEHEYNSHFIDYNHDGVADLLLQSLDEIEPSLFRWLIFFRLSNLLAAGSN
jgi:hypothetical protein